jgi:hypothetical protein
LCRIRRSGRFSEPFQGAERPRQQGKITYPLDEILLLCLVAVLAGAETVVDIALFGCKKRALLRRFRPFKDGTPAHDHLGDILAVLDAEQFQSCFVAWVAALTGVAEGVIAIDGKTSRRSGRKTGGSPPIHMVSAFAARQRLGNVIREKNLNKNSAALIAAMIALLIWLTVPLPAAAQLSQGAGDLRVMTYNVDEGTDYLEVGAATNLTQFLIAVGQTITQVRATNPPERMKAVAAQIIAAAPTLVSLQELDQWFSGSFDPVTQTCGPVTLEFDLLQELLDALS